jgi:hypothetical protein
MGCVGGWRKKVMQRQGTAVLAVCGSSSLSRGGIPQEDDARNTLRGCY